VLQSRTAHCIETHLRAPTASEKKLRTFEQRHLSVSKTARYAIMGSLEEDLTEVWIVCHGHGQLAGRFLSRFLAIERADRLVVAPEALSRYYLAPPIGGPHPPDTPVGANWMTSEDRDFEIADYVSYLDQLHDEIFSVVDRTRVRLWVLGFSQGTATAARWIARGQVEPDRVVLWAGLLPPELDAQSATRLVRRTPLTIVVGREDEFATPERVAEQGMRLKNLGVPFTTIRFDGGHEIKPDVLMQLTETTS
jgi:predicted esterase